MDCRGLPRCQPGPGGTDGGPARTVWVVLYPDCSTDADVGWVVIDAAKGVADGSIWNGVCIQ